MQKFNSLVNAFVDKVNNVAGTKVIKADETPFNKYLKQAQKGKISVLFDTATMTSTNITNYIFEVLDKIEKHTKISTNDDLELWKLADDIESALHILEKLRKDYVSNISYETEDIRSLVAHELGHMTKLETELISQSFGNYFLVGMVLK